MDFESLPADFRHCIKFHGHLCPGLTIGYRATKAALEALGTQRAQDEELIAIVENDSCSVDAVQALSGCTFGKGNFYFRDHGKQVFTFALRPSGRAVRVSLKAPEDRFSSAPEELKALSRKSATAAGLDPEDNKRHRALSIEHMLSCPESDMLDVETLSVDLPGRAQIHRSVRCERCGQPTMVTRIRAVDGRALCLPCSAKVECGGG